MNTAMSVIETSIVASYHLEAILFVCIARTPPQRARASQGPDPAPPRGKDVGPPATRSRSYRYITTLANPGVQVVPHPHPPGRTEPHPRDTHTPNEGTPTNKHFFESAQFPGCLSFRMNPFWSFGFCDFFLMDSRMVF